MNVENISLKDILSSTDILGGENYDKSPLSLYLSYNVSKLKEESLPKEIEESLNSINDFLLGERTKLKEVVAQSLVNLFSIDSVLKGKKPNHTVDFQKVLYNNPELTFKLMEKMFEFGETKDKNEIILNKELAEFSTKIALEEPTINPTRLLSSSYRAVKNRSEIESFLLDERNHFLIVSKLEEEGGYFLNKDKIKKDKDRKFNLYWATSRPDFGSLINIEKNADIKVHRPFLDLDNELKEKVEEKNEYFKEHNIRLLTALDKSQYLSIGKNYNLFKDNITSQSIVSFNDNNEIDKVLFNYSPVTKSIQIIASEESEKALTAAFKYLASHGVKKISLTDNGLRFGYKEVKNALSTTKIKEYKQRKQRQDNKRGSSF